MPPCYNLDMKRSEQLDEIAIEGLLVRAIVGINPEEREKKQDVVINLRLYGDLEQACLSDDIRDTVDYKAIKLGVIKLVEEGSPNLVEHMAHRIAEFCLAYDRVQRVRVQVQKPGALRFAKTVGFSIEREK